MEILVIIFIIISFVAKISRVKSNNETQRNQNQAMPPFGQSNSTKKVSYPGSYMGEVTRQTVTTNASSKSSVSAPASTIRPAYTSAKSTSNLEVAKPSTTIKKNESVVDYLANKAKNGQLQTDSDTRKQSIKNEKFQSSRISAGRLIYGDPVPKNKELVICHYCGAENLLPYNATNNYKCYFCREDI